MNGLKIFAAFVVGVGVGSGTTYIVVKNKFQQKANEDIEAIRELYSSKEAEKLPEEKIEENITQEVEAEKAKNKPDIMEYASKLKESGYKDYTGNKKVINNDISYISIDELGEEEDYDSITLTYYADGVLTDDLDDPIDDFIDMVGNFTTHFDEEDVVYVRNDRLKVYYEIVRDYSNYED